MKNIEKYNGWIVSNSLVKRSLAIFWHSMLWYLIVIFTIYLPIMIIVAILSAI